MAASATEVFELLGATGACVDPPDVGVEPRLRGALYDLMLPYCIASSKVSFAHNDIDATLSPAGLPTPWNSDAQ
jgi:hypothetical protein